MRMTTMQTLRLIGHLVKVGVSYLYLYYSIVEYLIGILVTIH